MVLHEDVDTIFRSPSGFMFLVKCYLLWFLSTLGMINRDYRSKIPLILGQVMTAKGQCRRCDLYLNVGIDV